MSSASAPVGVPGGHARARLAWVDATRGYSVAAVVLFHVVLWTYTYRTGVAEPAASWWSEVNGVLGSVRMPILLAVSGIVLSRQVRAGLHRSTTVFRAVNSYYLYVVWLAIYTVFYALVRDPTLPHRVDGLDALVQLVRPGTTLWYLAALALYVPVLAMARSIPPWLVLAALGTLSVGTQIAREAGDGAGLFHKILELFVFFAIGVYAAVVLRRMAERASVVGCALAAVVAAGVTLSGRWMTAPWAEAVVFVLRGAAFLVVGILGVVLACRWRPVERLGAALGERTILVYVLHPLLIAAVVLAEPSLDPLLHGIMANPVGALVYPAAMTAVVVTVCLAVDVLVRRLGWSALLGLPARAARAMGRQAPGPARPTVAPRAGPAAAGPA